MTFTGTSSKPLRRPFLIAPRERRSNGVKGPYGGAVVPGQVVGTPGPASATAARATSACRPSASARTSRRPWRASAATVFGMYRSTRPANHFVGGGAQDHEFCEQGLASNSSTTLPPYESASAGPRHTSNVAVAFGTSITLDEESFARSTPRLRPGLRRT